MRHLDIATAKPYSVIGLGTWQFGSREWGYGTDYAEGEAGRIVKRARELGITVFDTAEVYGFGRSERILGEALRDSGGTDDVVVASKVFPVMPTAAIVQQRGVASAQRLGVRQIDLYQVHQPNPVVGDSTTMRGMRALRDVGVIDEVGVSNYPLSRWQRAEGALGGARVLSNQVQFSLVSRGPMAEMLPWAQRTGHVVMAWSPLAQGLLSGRYNADHRPSGGVRATNSMFLPENMRAASPLLDLLRDVASVHDATPAQIALAWLVHFPNVVAIPGASSVAQVERNAAAADIVLSGSEHGALTAAAEAFHPTTGLSALPGLVRARR
ncbi:aldo/keto reductase [Pseudonocardia sp. KRD-184]|uniref:Aldo/keto reductase n=1 Tax=Pseudonocardia oceani TaxID=2792013 RepID=A0ABS6UFW7_9PSEU|nr:aldo/keto reductase [Pseudonocardia oceani]MBW0090576.1 aldo/keto reductase [Pseudonocardia oceani]MBW0095506.1 aldo/keto reductase [Pseudonocardia oceani]MBW0110302.1 aldo/keto reductase [Pseudonocardia oceani]MBW0122130.1 aldo/keto reductase [Pseudonocardia oceani]MBW0131135.1 aldo/keto reductase [Pseudonocardia oceani]